MGLTIQPIAGYRFDETSAGSNAADSIGSHTLTQYGTVTYVTALVNNGGSLGTSNTTKCFKSTTVGALLTGDYSISFFFKLLTQPPSNTNQNMVIGFYEGRTIIVDLNYQDDGGTKKVTISTYNGAGNESKYSVNLGTTNYHHFVMIYYKTPNTYDLYIDNSKVIDAFVGESLTGAFAEDRFVMGAADSDGSGAVSGIFDAAYIFNGAITTGDISYLYNSGNARQDPFASNVNSGAFFNFF